MSRVLRMMAAIFALVGLVFALTAGGVALWLRTSSEGMVSVPGTILRFEGSEPVVSYELSGETHLLRASTHSPAMRVGGTYTVLADPDDPARCVDAGLWALPVVFGVIGGVMLVTGWVMRLLARRGENKRSELRLVGLRAQATITEVKVDRSVNLGSRHPARLCAECVNPVTGQQARVRSHLIWPGTYAPGQTVTVLFDPLDPDKYAFDLPEETT